MPVLHQEGVCDRWGLHNASKGCEKLGFLGSPPWDHTGTVPFLHELCISLQLSGWEGASSCAQGPAPALAHSQGVRPKPSHC